LTTDEPTHRASGPSSGGRCGGRDALFAAAYSELHRLARARLRDGGRNTVLDTTCLVHESYLRFVRGEGISWVKGDPLLGSLVQDSRYKALLQKMRLPE
jgi:hypothetical protein